MFKLILVLSNALKNTYHVLQKTLLDKWGAVHRRIKEQIKRDKNFKKLVRQLESDVIDSSN